MVRFEIDYEDKIVIRELLLVDCIFIYYEPQNECNVIQTPVLHVHFIIT